MFRVIADAIEGLLTQFSWRRLMTLVVFLGIVAGTLAAFEHYTHYFHLARLQKATHLLSELSALENEATVGSDPELRELRDTIEADLVGLLAGTNGRASRAPWITRWLAGGTLWFLFSLIYLRDLREGKNIGPFIACIAVGALLGTLGLLIPSSAGRYIHFLAYPVGNFAFVMGSIIIAQKRKQRAA